MNRYGRLQELLFYSRVLYRDVACRWKSAGLLYLCTNQTAWLHATKRD